MAIRALESGRRATPRPYTVRALAEALALAEEDRLQLYAAAQAEPPSPEALPIPDTPAAGGERGRLLLAAPPAHPPHRARARGGGHHLRAALRASPPGDVDRAGRGRQDAPGHRRGRGHRGGLSGRRRLGRAGADHRPGPRGHPAGGRRDRPRAGDQGTGAAGGGRVASGSHRRPQDCCWCSTTSSTSWAPPPSSPRSWRTVRRWSCS